MLPGGDDNLPIPQPVQEPSAAEVALQKLQEQLQIVMDPQELRTEMAFPDQVRGNEYQAWSRKLSQDQLERAERVMHTLRKGTYASSPIVCQGLEGTHANNGRSCMHAHICPFKDSTPPVGLQCPMEQRKIVDWLQGYLQDHQVTPLMTTMYELINRLVELDLFNFRLTSVSSSPKYQSMMVYNPKGATRDGDLYGVEEISGILQAKENISRERLRLLAELVKTPREQYKKEAALQKTEQDSYSSNIEKIKGWLFRLEQESQRKRGKLEGPPGEEIYEALPTDPESDTPPLYSTPYVSADAGETTGE